MKTATRRLIAAVGLLAAAGAARMPVEQAMTERFREDGLLREPVDVATQKKLGQGFFAVSLGGLRTLVATIWNLRAFGYFEGKQWVKLADTYETIVLLAPHSDYYWDTGSWHMAYNASVDYRNREHLPELRREAEWRQWVERGTAFLEEGARQNPDSWRLWAALGRLYVDPFKLIDYEKAAEAYHRSAETGNALPYVRRAEALCRARIPGREDEALPLVRELNDGPRGKVPTLNCVRFVLELRADPGIDRDRLAAEVFGTPERAWRELGDFYLGSKDYPMNGVRTMLRRLERELQIPDEQSVLRNP